MMGGKGRGSLAARRCGRWWYVYPLGAGRQLDIFATVGSGTLSTVHVERATRGGETEGADVRGWGGGRRGSQQGAVSDRGRRLIPRRSWWVAATSRYTGRRDKEEGRASGGGGGGARALAISRPAGRRQPVPVGRPSIPGGPCGAACRLAVGAGRGCQTKTRRNAVCEWLQEHPPRRRWRVGMPVTHIQLHSHLPTHGAHRHRLFRAHHPTV